MLNKIKLFFSNHFNIMAFFIFAVVIFSLYGKTLTFDWTYYDDDVLILDKQDFFTFSNIKNIFFSTVFGQEKDKFCRPILNLTFLVEKYLYATKAFGYHLTNLIIHLFAVFSVFIFLTLKYDKKKVLLICILFACHPALVQAVVWIPGRNDSLLTIFVMLSCYYFVKYIDSNKILYLFEYLMFFIFALLTKETAIIILIFYFIYLMYREKTIKQYCIIFTNISLIVLLYLLYRSFVLSYQQYSLTLYELFKNFIESLPLTTKYIANIFFPLKLSIFPTMLELDYLLAIASMLIFILLFVKFKKQYNLKIIIFGFCWFLLFLFPTFIMPNNHCFDHRIYISLVGILVVILECICNSKINLSKQKIVFFSIILIIFCSITLFYERKFQNKEVFWVNAYEMSPNSDIANAMVGWILMEKGMYKESESKFLKAIELRKSSKHYVNLAAVYFKMQNLDEAEKHLLKALELDNCNPNTYYNLALIYKIKGELDKAQEMKYWYIKVFNDTNKVSKIDQLDI